MLTEREEQVARLVALGLTNRQIECRLGVSKGTVQYHLRNAAAKYGIRRKLMTAVGFHCALGGDHKHLRDRLAEIDMPEQERVVVSMLIRGEHRTTIAKALGISEHYKLEQLIRKILGCKGLKSSRQLLSEYAL